MNEHEERSTEHARRTLFGKILNRVEQKRKINK